MKVSRRPVVSPISWPIVPSPRALFLLLVLLVGACGGNIDGAPTITTGPGAESAEAAVEELRSLLIAGDFASASALAVPKQAALASLAEGATFSQVARALEGSDAQVAANFWSGFAQGVGDTFPNGAAVEATGTRTESGVEFFLVGVTSESGVERLVVTQDIDGHRIDLFASFASGFAGRLISPIEILLTSLTEDALLILSEMKATVPSLLVASSDESLTPEAVQKILQLIELITRVG